MNFFQGKIEMRKGMYSRADAADIKTRLAANSTSSRVLEEKTRVLNPTGADAHNMGVLKGIPCNEKNFASSNPPPSPPAALMHKTHIRPQSFKSPLFTALSIIWVK